MQRIGSYSISIRFRRWTRRSLPLVPMTNKLTVEKMDRINFLLTEVSLECLGNRFFDIYGDQSDTLLQLVSVDSLKPKDVNADFRTALWDALGLEKTAVRVADQVHIAKPLARKRRASFSGQNETDDIDPESLLVPMQKAPEPFALPTAPAKVNRRRFTVNVSQLQKQTQKMLTPEKSPKAKAGSVQDIVEHLRNDIKSSRFTITMHFRRGSRAI